MFKAMQGPRFFASSSHALDGSILSPSVGSKSNSRSERTDAAEVHIFTPSSIQPIATMRARSVSSVTKRWLLSLNAKRLLYRR